MERYIVGVHSHNIFSFSQAKPPVQGCNQSLIRGVTFKYNSMVAIVQKLLKGTIGRPIIYDNKLKVLKTLAQHTLDRLVNERFSIVDRHHNTYCGIVIDVFHPRGLIFCSYH